MSQFPPLKNAQILDQFHSSWVCPMFTEADECRSNACGFDRNSNQCSSRCEVISGQAIIGKPYAAAMDNADCHTICRENASCSYSMELNGFCYMYYSIAFLEDDINATSIFCLHEDSPSQVFHFSKFLIFHNRWHFILWLQFTIIICHTRNSMVSRNN